MAFNRINSHSVRWRGRALVTIVCAAALSLLSLGIFRLDALYIQHFSANDVAGTRAKKHIKNNWKCSAFQWRKTKWRECSLARSLARLLADVHAYNSKQSHLPFYFKFTRHLLERKELLLSAQNRNQKQRERKKSNEWKKHEKYIVVCFHRNGNAIIRACIHACLRYRERLISLSGARTLARLCVRLAFGFTWLVCMLLYVYSYNSMNLLFVLTISEA